MQFWNRCATSAGFVFAKRGLEQRFAAAPEHASETGYAQKPETQTIRSEHAAPAAGAEGELNHSLYFHWNPADRVPRFKAVSIDESDTPRAFAAALIEG